MKDPLLGAQLANFRVDRLLGQGGMASVYYGQDIKLHRPVAIKVLDKRYKNHPAYAARFVNEARMMAKWHHENIIQIYYSDEESGFPYYVMEYVDGQDLSAIISQYQEQGKLMPIAEVLRISRAIASALDYAHQHGVIHRDVKPSNILLSKDGRILLGDFGMALELRDGSQGTVFGSPHYISPEQARRSADAIPQSDLYSLGVILYELLTGAVPFNAEEPSEIALQQISMSPPLPRSINPDLKPAVEAVLLKALQKDSRERYQSGDKLVTALAEALNSTGEAKRTTLPPLPVGVPTLHRRDASLEKIANRNAPKGQAAQKPAGKMPATVRISDPAKRKNYWGAGIILLVLLGIGLTIFLARKPTIAVLPEPTLTLTLQTPTELVLPTQTFTLAPPSPTTESATREPTFTPTSLPTDTSTPPPTIVAQPTVMFPEGNLYRLFYNETSFYMLNRSYGHRSISGFVFQRLDTDGLPMEDIFQGFRWETSRFDYLPRNFCVNITLYGDQDPPYLDPGECRAGLMKTIQPRFDKPEGILFWTPKDGSTQFRVLWLDTEVARCEITAGACDFYIP
ncbi:MAG TPA: serine/threonine-protein kinase [Anaerolineales bacterium]|nr:serine/threonine-protein kinase [Anaerolineales bacterium]